MVSKQRTERIAERIFEELSSLLLMEVADPRLEAVSITHVTVDRELMFANVYISSYEGSERAEEMLAGLNHACGYLRSELARRMQLRTTPRLRFQWDPSPEYADRIDRLLATLKRDEGEPPQEQENNPDE